MSENAEGEKREVSVKVSGDALRQLMEIKKAIEKNARKPVSVAAVIRIVIEDYEI